jgi:ComF family protein
MQRVLDVVLPPTCPGCGREGEALCVACRAVMSRRRDEPAAAPIGLPVRTPPGIVQLEWCCSYTGPARACVHALKYDGERRLVQPLAQLMAERWQRVAIGGEVLVPVPVHAARLRQRGFDQAELLARAVGRLLDLPVQQAVRRASRTTAQHQLGRSARAGNVRSAFAADAHSAAVVAGRWVVVIDDVVTTGATLAGCARVLHEAGARAVSALCLAHER